MNTMKTMNKFFYLLALWAGLAGAAAAVCSCGENVAGIDEGEEQEPLIPVEGVWVRLQGYNERMDMDTTILIPYITTKDFMNTPALDSLHLTTGYSDYVRAKSDCTGRLVTIVGIEPENATKQTGWDYIHGFGGNSFPGIFNYYGYLNATNIVNEEWFGKIDEFIGPLEYYYNARVALVPMCCGIPEDAVWACPRIGVERFAGKTALVQYISYGSSREQIDKYKDYPYFFLYLPEDVDGQRKYFFVRFDKDTIADAHADPTARPLRENERYSRSIKDAYR